MTELDTSDALAPLRKLANPGQVAALRAECDALGRRLVQLRAANAEHWLRLKFCEQRHPRAEPDIFTGEPDG